MGELVILFLSDKDGPEQNISMAQAKIHSSDEDKLRKPQDSPGSSASHS